MSLIRNKIAALTALLILLSGCSLNSRDITEFKLISIIGVDAEEGDKIKLTVSAKEETKPGGEAPKGDKPLLLTDDSRTISHSLSRMETYTDKYLYLGHDRYCLVGEELARRGIDGVLDFFTRDPNARLDTKLYVIKDGKAVDLLSKASGNNSFAADRLASIEKEMGGGSGINGIVDIANALEERGVAVARSLKLVPQTAHDATAQETGKQAESSVPDNGGDSLDFDLDGCAVFQDGRLTAYISVDDVTGYELLNGKYHNNYFEVKSPDGRPVSLHTQKAERELKVTWENGVPVLLEVKIRLESALAESLSHMPESALTEALAESQSEIIKSRVESVISQSRALGCDFIGLGMAVNRRHPVKFSAIEDEWDEIWKTLPVELTVETKITSTLNIKEAL